MVKLIITSILNKISIDELSFSELIMELEFLIYEKKWLNA